MTMLSWLSSHSLFHRNNCYDIQYREPERVNQAIKVTKSDFIYF